MKQREIKPCVGCGKPPFHGNQPMALHLGSATRQIVNVPAVRRHVGLEMMLGGNALIANVMGPNEDMTVPVGEPISGLVCMDCAIRLPLLELMSRAEEQSQPATGAAE